IQLNGGSPMKLMKPVTLAVIGVTLLGGCSSIPNPIDNLNRNTSGDNSHTVEVDVVGAESSLRSAGFLESDFGSSEAMRSAATMLSALGAEWQTFDTWTDELFDRHSELKG